MAINWIIPQETYLNYLRSRYESRIPFSDYGKNKLKPFFGTLFTVDELVYIAQISHPQSRHAAIKGNIDFMKIRNPSDGRLLGVINLNFMLPIHESLYEELVYKNIEKHREFKSEYEKSKYINLLKKELAVMNTLPICKNALRLNEIKVKYPESPLAKRSFNFKDLESACRLFIKNT